MSKDKQTLIDEWIEMQIDMYIEEKHNGD
jgi:hypothetical protein